jgi:hypothetical protein
MNKDSTENTRTVDLILALNDFAQAATALVEAWERATDSVSDALREGYPLSRSFDEETFEIVTWCRKASATLTRRLD